MTGLKKNLFAGPQYHGCRVVTYIFCISVRMKEKVEQQEEELNLSNPRLFMDAQSASKEEVLYGACC